MEAIISHFAVGMIGFFLGGLVMFILGSLKTNSLNDQIDDLNDVNLKLYLEVKAYEKICEE